MVRIRWDSARCIITRSFGIKPVRGGNPAKDNKRNLVVIVIRGWWLNSFVICDLDEINIRTINRGIIINEYMVKYRSVMKGMLIFKVLIIHPECVIDE